MSKRAALESRGAPENDSNMLPLYKNLKRVAVIGPNANEKRNLVCRYGPANPPITTVYEGIKAFLPDAEVNYAKGCDIRDPIFP